MGVIRNNHMNITIKTRTRIPTRGLWQVLQPDHQSIRGIRPHTVGHVKIEGIITIRPISNLLTIQINLGITHRPVKQDHRPFTRSESGRLKTDAVPTDTHEWQTTRPAGMLQSLLLAILGDSHLLLIVLGTERTINRPIMRNGYRLPGGIIIRGINESLLLILPSEAPPFLQQKLMPDLSESFRQEA